MNSSHLVSPNSIAWYTQFLEPTVRTTSSSTFEACLSVGLAAFSKKSMTLSMAFLEPALKRFSLNSAMLSELGLQSYFISPFCVLDLSSLASRRLPEPSSSSSSSSSAVTSGWAVAALAKMLGNCSFWDTLKRLTDLPVLKMLTVSLGSVEKMFLRRDRMLWESISSLGASPVSVASWFSFCFSTSTSSLASEGSGSSLSCWGYGAGWGRGVASVGELLFRALIMRIQIESKQSPHLKQHHQLWHLKFSNGIYLVIFSNFILQSDEVHYKIG